MPIIEMRCPIILAKNEQNYFDRLCATFLLYKLEKTAMLQAFAKLVS